MELVFWGALSLAAYGYLGYPALVLLLGRWRSRRVAAAPITPRVSLIVSVHNGEHIVRDKIANCLALDYPADRLEILVASDGSTDTTNDLVRRVPDPRVRLVAVTQRRGKEFAQCAAIAQASGDILVFTDVGVRTPPGALRATVANFADAAVGCVSGVDRVLDQRGKPTGEGAFVHYETLLKTLESRLGSTVGNSGWFFALRRSLCDVWPHDMASDFTMLLRTVRRGFRGVVEPQALGYALAASTSKEFQRKVRTIVRGMIVLAAHKDMLNPLRYGFFAIQLVSHKVVRWLFPFLLILILGASVVLAQGSAFYRAILLAQLLFYGTGLLMPALRLPHFFVSSSAAAAMAWWKFLLGEKFVVWEPTPRIQACAPLTPRNPTSPLT